MIIAHNWRIRFLNPNWDKKTRRRRIGLEYGKYTFALHLVGYCPKTDRVITSGGETYQLVKMDKACVLGHMTRKVLLELPSVDL